MAPTAFHSEDDLLLRARAGDIVAFQQLFTPHQDVLRAYLYRITTDRNDAADLAQDTFVRAFDRIGTFEARSSFKTWLFRIATNLAYDQMKRRKPWPVDVKQRSKEHCLSTPDVQGAIERTHAQSPEGAFEIRDHIDHCFTCMGRTLLVEKQVALILKEIYDFPVKDIALIMGKSEDVVKHLLQDARRTMMDIFDARCALINKKGVCNQCSELNGWFNPKQDQQAAVNELDLVRGSQRYDREALFELRTQLVRAVDPLHGPGADLQDILMRCDRVTMGEVADMGS